MKLTAKEARSLTIKNSVNLDDVYAEIRILAGNAENKYYTTRPLTDDEKRELLDFGYSVKDLGSLAIQKDGIYQEILW